MGPQRIHRQRTLSFRSRPAAQRSGFVSYSGSVSPKLKTNLNANTSITTHKYTPEQKWDMFLTNGCPHFRKNCLLLCDVIYGWGMNSFWEESHGVLLEDHAEVKALRRIHNEENNENNGARFVMLYLSYSPCANCANFILEFSRCRPECTVSVAFSCLFRHEEEIHKDGLRRLNAAQRILIGVFGREEWNRLAEALGMEFLHDDPVRDSWDERWKNIFETILEEEEPSAHLSHFVPSQRTEPTSGMISGISFPQGHQETGPIAGRSRIFTIVSALWTRRGGDNEDREVMSNDTTIQISEGSGSDARHMKMSKRNRLIWCSVILTIICIIIIIVVSVCA